MGITEAIMERIHDRTMRKATQLALIILITAQCAFAQPGPGGMRKENMARIHAAKMAYITDRIQLSTSQSAEFIPLYNEYERELRDIRQSYLKKYKGMDMMDANDATARDFVDDNLDYQQEVLTLKRKYKDRFLKVISAQQVATLQKAEQEFRQGLKKRLEERRAR
jgi:hypothetical protein